MIICIKVYKCVHIIFFFNSLSFMSQHEQWEDSFKMLDIILCIIFFYNAFKEEI